MYESSTYEESISYEDFYEENESALKERMKHISDTFQQYLFYLIEADRFGINADRAVNYHCDREGTAVNYKALSRTVSSVRNCKNACEMKSAFRNWDEDIKTDYLIRK